MSFLVATNIVASRPTERRPTGMPHFRANYTTHTLRKDVTHQAGSGALHTIGHS